MKKANNISDIWKLTSDLESYILQPYRDALNLSQKLQDCKDNSSHKPPFEINYLQYFNCQETDTSWIIRHIFAYKYKYKDKEVHPFLVSFVETFLQGKGFKKEWIDKPIIDKDHEYKDIDISIRDKKYAIIIENKLKGAQFQLNQLARYIAKMREEGYKDEQIFVVILQKENNKQINKSVWKLPKDWKSPSKDRNCRVDDYTCKCDCEDYKQMEGCEECQHLWDIFKSRVIIIHSELSEWLYECVVNKTAVIPEEELHNQYVLTSAILQFVDFLNYLYKTRESDQFKMDIQNFLSNKLKLNGLSIEKQLLRVEDKIKDAQDLVDWLNDLRKSKIIEYITDLGNKYPHLENIYPQLKFDKGIYFHYELDFDNIQVTVRVGNDNDGKGDFCQIESGNKRGIPIDIRNNSVISKELNDERNRDFYIWKYDSYKNSCSRFIKVLDEILKLKNNKKST